jgi:hypothetical protein
MIFCSMRRALEHEHSTLCANATRSCYPPRRHTLLDSHPDWQKGNNSRRTIICQMNRAAAIYIHKRRFVSPVRTWMRTYINVCFISRRWNIHFWQARAPANFPIVSEELQSDREIARFGCFGRAGVTSDLSVTGPCTWEWKLYMYIRVCHAIYYVCGTTLGIWAFRDRLNARDWMGGGKLLQQAWLRLNLANLPHTHTHTVA